MSNASSSIASLPPVEATNNFDLLRLLAAFQVVWFHGLQHLDLHAHFGSLGQTLNQILGHFHGVPIFFVISGFLISKSYERSSSIRSYARKRFLRIYPALWVSFAVTLVLISLVGVLSWKFVTTPSFAAWVLAQLTFAQTYHPKSLQFGIGTINGSLWTIPIELGFYVCLPIVYIALKGLSSKAGDLFLAFLAMASFTTWYLVNNHPDRDHAFWLKVINLSPVAYVYMFLIGIFCHRNFDRLRGFFEGKVLFWTAGYVLMMLLQDAWWGPSAKIMFLPALLANLTLAAFTLSFAFSKKTLSHTLLRGNDISYGLYIYHMLVINLFVHYQAVGQFRYFGAVVFISLSIAALSWRLIEAPALRLKK